MSRFDLTFARRLTLVARSARKPSPLIGKEEVLLKVLQRAEIYYEIGVRLKATDYQISKERAKHVVFRDAINKVVQIRASMTIDELLATASFGLSDEEPWSYRAEINKSNEWSMALHSIKLAADKLVAERIEGTPKQLGNL